MVTRGGAPFTVRVLAAGRSPYRGLTRPGVQTPIAERRMNEREGASPVRLVEWCKVRAVFFGASTAVVLVLLVACTPIPARVAEEGPAVTQSATPSPAATASTPGPVEPGATPTAASSATATTTPAATPPPPPVSVPSPPAAGRRDVSADVRVFIAVAATLDAAGTPITPAAVAAASSEAAALLASGRARMSGNALQVYVGYAGEVQAAIDALSSAGARVETTSAADRLIQASIPLRALAKVGVLPSTDSLRLPDYGITAR